MKPYKTVGQVFRECKITDRQRPTPLYPPSYKFSTDSFSGLLDKIWGDWLMFNHKKLNLHVQKVYRNEIHCRRASTNAGKSDL